MRTHNNFLITSRFNLNLSEDTKKKIFLVLDTVFKNPSSTKIQCITNMNVPRQMYALSLGQ